MRLAVACAALVALVCAAVAGGQRTAATPWPTTNVSVWNDTLYGKAFVDAMDAWNAVGTRVTLVPAPSRETARVVIGYLDAPTSPGQVGLATMGWVPAHRGKVNVVRGLQPRSAGAVLAHELGHVLGLEHSGSRCSVMNAVVEVGRGSSHGCALASCQRVSTCLVSLADARALRDLYERRLPALTPPSVSAIAARSSSGRQAAVVVRWTSPEIGSGVAILVRVTHEGCPSSPYSAPLSRTALVALEPGHEQTLRVPVSGPGRWCAGVWVQATDSYLTGTAALTRVVVR